MTYALLLLALLFAPSLVRAAPCTDGVDCFCDTISNPSVQFCEDFESTALTQDVIDVDGRGAWYYTTTGDGYGGGFRGSLSAWHYHWGPPNALCSYRDGEPASPQLGTPCSTGGSDCNISAWHPTDLWGNAATSCIHVQRDAEVGDEISGLALSGGTSGGTGNVFDGNQYFAHRIAPARVSGIGSGAANPGGSLIGFGSTWGQTFARAYSSNLFTSNPGQHGSEWLSQPWKADQTGNGLQFPEGNTGGDFNNPPFAGGNAFVSDDGACATAVAAADVLIGGGLQCQAGVLRFGAAEVGDCASNPNCDASNEFQRSRDWDLGTWGCVRAYWGGFATSNAEMWIEFQGPNDSAPRRIFWVQNLDMVGWLSTGSIGNPFIDGHYNGNDVGGTNNIETFYSYQDNVVFTDDQPVSCADIGFSVGPDTTPPIRYDPRVDGISTPTELTNGTTQANISLLTDEDAVCQYIAGSVCAAFDDPSMIEMTTTGSAAPTRHEQIVSSLSDGGSYDYCVVCSDGLGNANDPGSPFLISFSVAAAAPDTSPPVLSAPFPNGSQYTHATTTVPIGITTSEFSACKWDPTDIGGDPATAYAAMANTYTTGDGLAHPSDFGSLSAGNSYVAYTICCDDEGTPNCSATGYAGVNFSVNAAEDTTPPLVYRRMPTGTLGHTAKTVLMSVRTDKDSECRYYAGAPNGTVYADMTLDMVDLGYKPAFSAEAHWRFLTNMTPGLKTYQVRCINVDGYESGDAQIQFTIANPPAPPTPTYGGGTFSGTFAR